MLFGVGKLGSQPRKTDVVTVTPGDPGPETNTYAYDISKLERDQPGTNEWVDTALSSPRCFTWNSDGTKFIMSAFFLNYVRHTSVSTAYDISTASGTFTNHYFANLGSEYGAFFSADGTKLFVVLATDIIHRIDLATAFTPLETETSVANANLSTLSSGANNNAAGGSISTDGTIMHIWDNTDDAIYQYTMSTAYDLSTLTYDVMLDSDGPSSAKGFAFNGDGTKLYVMDSSASDSTLKIHNYTLSTAFDIDTKGSIHSTINFATEHMIRDPEILSVSPDGTRLYMVSPQAAVALKMHTANDLSTIVPDGVDYYQRSNSSGGGAHNTTSRYHKPFFNDDGTKLIFLEPADDAVISVNLNTPYSLTSGLGNTETSYSVSAQETTPSGFHLKPDGTRFYIVGAGDTVFQYNMTTAFDISTASYSGNSFSVSSQETNPQGLTFKPDGTKFFVSGTTSDDLHEYALSTAWDVSTASFTQTQTNFLSNPREFTFNGDGTQLIVGMLSAGLEGINLSTGYDVSTRTGAVSGIGGSWADGFRLHPYAIAPNWQKSGEILLMGMGNNIIKFSANDKRMVEQIYSPEIVIQSPLTSADDARNYHVLNIEFRADTLPSDFSGRLFIGHKLRGNSTFDMCVGAVQILNSSSSRVYAWQGSDFTNWETTTNEGNASPADYSDVMDYFETGSYASIASGSTDGRWNVASSTADLNTGAADGVSTTYGSGGSDVLPISGAFQVAQTASTNFVYTPTGSGSSSGDYIWMRSPKVTLESGIHQFRLAYLFSTNSTAAKIFDTLQVFWADADS